MNLIKQGWQWLRRPNKSAFEQALETFFVILPLAFIIRTFFYGLYQVPTGSMETTMLVGERFFADKFTVLFWPPQHGEIISFNDPNFDYSDNKYTRLFQRYVWGPTNWTKRVIGMPGDHVQGVMEDGKPIVYLNGKKLDEPYVNKHPLLALYKEGRTPPWEFRSWDNNVSYQEQPFYSMNQFDATKAHRILQHYGQEHVRPPYEPVMDSYGHNMDEYDIHLASDEYWVMGDNRRGSSDSRFFGPLKAEHIHGKIIWRIMSIDSSDSWLIFDLLSNPISFWKRVRWSRFFQKVV